MSDVQVQISGLVELDAKVNQMIADMRGEAFRGAMRRATALVTESAKRNAPVDTGRIRASITPELRVSGVNVLGVVGTNVKYAAAVELGSKPHWMPKAPLRQWVSRVLKKRGAELESVTYLIQRKIAMKGTKAKPYLQPAFDANKERIVAIIGDAVAQIVSK
jgi:HK97 gp10 family phage protein